MTTINEAISPWLSSVTGLDCFWLKRPEDENQCVVYRCLTPGVIQGNLRPTGICEDVYSFTIYHANPDQGKTLADAITAALHHFTGELNSGAPNAYPIQLATFTGGGESWLTSEVGSTVYQFTRDFIINH
ncbi:hypothetical protein [Vibrio fluvialis]|uniref:hypothetical protein n=1 Tax=Vibrio fluvialis TaxID=676 RepID=UPI00399A8EC3